jgi:DNA-binding beta-propeller fold protein YncE
MNPQTSSISILSAPGAKGDSLSLLGSVYEGRELDVLQNVGDTHPSATAIVRHGKDEILYVTKSNVDRLGVIDLTEGRKLHDINLSPILAENDRYQGDGDRDSDDLRRVKLSGAYPNAIVVSPDNDRLYVAEAGLNSVAVLDTSECRHPKLLGRIPTGWYPTALTISQDGRYLYVTNAKGIGEDINPSTPSTGTPPPTGLASDPRVDSNFIFGSLQKIDLAAYDLDNHSVLAYNFAKHHDLDISVVPVGQEPSKKIKHVFFILHENKTFDSILGNLSAHFGNYAGTTFTNIDGSAYTNGQFTGVALNTQLLAAKFASGANYYSDSEESDAGHQFAASGTATDYTEKTLLVKSGRGLLVNKNFEPEDYPASGYIFNNAARHNVSFKDYGAMIRIDGTDTGTSVPTTVNDLPSGNLGYPTLKADNFTITSPVVNAGDVSSPTKGLGQSYFLTLPIVAVLGTKNKSGEARLDLNYPGYNFNISDQRRAAEFIQDFDRMVNQGTLPELVYIYQPNDHTGGVQAPNNGSVISKSPVQQVADGDVGLGMVVKHIMESPIYYNKQTGEGSAIFITYDDAQSTRDHIHPHRTPLVVVSPYAKPGYVSLRHYVTASVVKTEELLLGLPPNNLGDLFATDLRDLFQPKYNHITAKDLAFNFSVTYTGSKEGAKIWKLVSKLDTSAPDRDSFRLGALARMSMRADELHNMASATRQLYSGSYKAEQSALYRSAIKLVSTSMPKDADD